MAAKKKTEPKLPDRTLRAVFGGVLAECVRTEGELHGLLADIEALRYALTERYKDMGWLKRENGAWVLHRPSAEAEARQA